MVETIIDTNNTETVVTDVPEFLKREDLAEVNVQPVDETATEAKLPF